MHIVLPALFLFLAKAMQDPGRRPKHEVQCLGSVASRTNLWHGGHVPLHAADFLCDIRRDHSCRAGHQSRARSSARAPDKDWRKAGLDRVACAFGRLGGRRGRRCAPQKKATHSSGPRPRPGTAGSIVADGVCEQGAQPGHPFQTRACTCNLGPGAVHGTDGTGTGRAQEAGGL